MKSSETPSRTARVAHCEINNTRREGSGIFFKKIHTAGYLSCKSHKEHKGMVQRLEFLKTQTVQCSYLHRSKSIQYYFGDYHQPRSTFDVIWGIAKTDFNSTKQDIPHFGRKAVRYIGIRQVDWNPLQCRFPRLDVFAADECRKCIHLLNQL